MKCSVCSKEGKDILIYQVKKKNIMKKEIVTGVKSKNFCREHLIEEYKNKILEHQGKLIMYYPAIEGLKGGYTYTYMDINEIKNMKSNFKDGVKIIEKNIKRIEGKCEECDSEATVAFYNKDDIPWDKEGGFYKISGNMIMLDEIKNKPAYLCKACAVKKIENSLKYFLDDYKNGISIPYTENGVLIPIKL
ncbi:MAG: hypothetical protein ACERKV_04005 [Clostridiaceae bacterium]